MTKKPVFGKRGREKEIVERKPTLMERVKKAASRLWPKKAIGKKKAARGERFRR
jgi:hypothetical protein